MQLNKSFVTHLSRVLTQQASVRLESTRLTNCVAQRPISYISGSLGSYSTVFLDLDRALKCPKKLGSRRMSTCNSFNLQDPTLLQSGAFVANEWIAAESGKTYKVMWYLASNSFSVDL